MIIASKNGHKSCKKQAAQKSFIFCLIAVMMVTSCHRSYEEIPLESYGFAPVPATEIATTTNPPERTYTFECTLNEFATWLTESDIYCSVMGIKKSQAPSLAKIITVSVNEIGARPFIESTSEIGDPNLHFRVKAKAIGKENKVKVTVEVFELQ